MHIKEFAEQTGVSIRTLRYYDRIGLLRPAFVDPDTGYRFYDDASLHRMQDILFYRELDFSLKSISEILSAPGYDKQQALQTQKRLLILKKERLQRLIDAVDAAMEGETIMEVFDNRDFTQYKAEVEEKWGKTQAYAEYKEKKPANQDAIQAEMDAIFLEFAQCKAAGTAPASDEAKTLVKKLQNFISANFYHCTDAILRGLGQMYVADDRFRANIDRQGAGTAEYVSQAIACSCR